MASVEKKTAAVKPAPKAAAPVPKPAAAAETNPVTGDSPDLKYLGSIRAFVLSLLVQLHALYVYAKESSGVLKPGLESVETTVFMVVGPVYSKIEDKPDEILKLLDSKIDQAVVYLHDSPLIEQAKSKLKIPQPVEALYKSYKEKGAVETASAVVDEYKPKAFAAAHFAWAWILALPLVPQAVLYILPMSVLVLEKYNKLLTQIQHSSVPLVRNASLWAPAVNTEALEKIVRKDVDEALAK